MTLKLEIGIFVLHYFGFYKCIIDVHFYRQRLLLQFAVTLSALGIVDFYLFYLNLTGS